MTTRSTSRVSGGAEAKQIAMIAEHSRTATRAQRCRATIVRPHRVPEGSSGGTADGALAECANRRFSGCAG